MNPSRAKSHQCNRLIHSPLVCAHPKMLFPDCREFSSQFCPFSCQPWGWKINYNCLYPVSLLNILNLACTSIKVYADIQQPWITDLIHNNKRTDLLWLYTCGVLLETYFACASACIKMNSHFLAKALCSLAKLSCGWNRKYKLEKKGFWGNMACSVCPTCCWLQPLLLSDYMENKNRNNQLTDSAQNQNIFFSS